MSEVKSEVKSGFVPFLEKTFFARPKIGFFISLSLILIWSYYSYINYYFNVERWYNCQFLANTWYELMVRNNYIYAFIPLLSATAIGRLIENLNLVYAFYEFTKKIGKMLSQWIDSFKVDDYLKITISSDLKTFISEFKPQFEMLFDNSIDRFKTTTHINHEPLEGFITWEFVEYTLQGGSKYVICNVLRNEELNNSRFHNLDVPIRTISDLISTLVTLNSRNVKLEFMYLEQWKKHTDRISIGSNNIVINSNPDIKFTDFVNSFEERDLIAVLADFFYAYTDIKKYAKSDITIEEAPWNKLIFKTYTNMLSQLTKKNAEDVIKIRHINVVHNTRILNKIIMKLKNLNLINLKEEIQDNKNQENGFFKSNLKKIKKKFNKNL